jgi:hypothetical protein
VFVECCKFGQQKRFKTAVLSWLLNWFAIDYILQRIIAVISAAVQMCLDEENRLLVLPVACSFNLVAV